MVQTQDSDTVEVIIRPNSDCAADLVARLIARELRANPRLVLGLATGRTMEAVYARLRKMHREDGLDFSGCRTFNLDEYVGLPGSDRHSYRHYMNHHLFLQVNIPLENTFLPDGMAEDLVEECARYEEKIRECGGIDLQLVGIGKVGHLGFNEPLSSLSSRTRVKVLSPVTRAQNSPLFLKPDDMPLRAVTMGVGTILDTRRCVMLASGEDKAAIVAKALEGPLSGMISATALQIHPRCTVVLDEAAAKDLKEADYYRWVYDHEPEWADLREPTTNGHVVLEAVKRLAPSARPLQAPVAPVQG
jgi:glucosamine-6-phosphate deaminase